MNLDTLVNTLRALDAFNGRVTVATNLESAAEAVKAFNAMPCIVIHGLSERAEDNTRSTGGPCQRVTVTLRLLIFNRDVTDSYGAAAMAGVHAARTEVQTALHGLIPDPGYTELLLIGGQLAYAQAGTIMWLDDWRTSYHLDNP
jgi:hypothetical protein